MQKEDSRIVVENGKEWEYVWYFFFNDTATTEIYTLSLHDALPISRPITIPTIGKRYMFFAIESRLEFDVGIIVRNEKIEPICLSN